MFDEVSPRYDLTNDLLSLGNSRLWRIATTRAIAPRKGMRVLDVAAGTGTSSAAIAAHGASVVAADFSEGMLSVGRERQGENELIEFVHADATKLPFDDNTFDAVTISFGLRNVNEPKKALAEMMRVTKPGGRIVICEFSHPPLALIRHPYFFYTKHVMPHIAGLITGAGDAYEYLNDSIVEWPNQHTLASWMRDAGFEQIAFRNLTAGIVALHRGTVPAKKSGTAKPAAKKPAVKKPAAAKPAAKKPAAAA
jgi:demethylmenaquinone methyltransferase/2-methoxy-6-polyprenyl-1,4-benzoquinol methylase